MPDPKHDMDPVTEYCKKCGAAAITILNKRWLCTDAENVIGISHLVARRRFEPLIRPVLDNLGVDFKP